MNAGESLWYIPRRLMPLHVAKLTWLSNAATNFTQEPETSHDFHCDNIKINGYVNSGYCTGYLTKVQKQFH